MFLCPQRHQRGLGASAVSITYARRCHQKYDLLWQLPKIVGLPNPMPDEERVSLPAGTNLPEFKASAGTRASLCNKEKDEMKRANSLNRVV